MDSWLHNWTQRVGYRLSVGSNVNRISVQKPKLSALKKKLAAVSRELKELEILFNQLRVLQKSLSENDWSQRCSEIEMKKENITNLMQEFTENPNLITLAASASKKRQQKRKRLKNQKHLHQDKVKLSKLQCELEHNKINKWLNQMKDKVERERRAEEVKREADLVLSDVTRKKSEAKRILNLLNTLIKLRSSRSNPTNSDLHENDAFNQVMSRLKTLWLDQINEYNTEEQGLKLMLTSVENDAAQAELSKMSDCIKLWTRTLFGKDDGRFEITSFDQLVAIRHQWDQFIDDDDDDNKLASSIPIGWVLPDPPSSADWKEFLV